MADLAQYQELVPFLRDTNPQVRQLALSNLLGQTVKSAPHRQALFFPSAAQNDKGPLWSLKLLCRDQTMIAHDAFSTLVNLSDSALVQNQLADDDFLVFLVSYIVVSPSSSFASPTHSHSV